MSRSGLFTVPVPSRLTDAGTDKDQLSLTNPRDALDHGERAANK